MADLREAESIRADLRRRRRQRWAVAAVLALFLPIVYIYYLVALESRRVTVGKDTTFLSGPLNRDGTVNYTAARNAKFGQGVTAENNAAVLIFRAEGPVFFDNDSLGLDRESLAVLSHGMPTVFEELGLGDLPPDGKYFIDWSEYRMLQAAPRGTRLAEIAEAVREGRPYRRDELNKVLRAPAEFSLDWEPTPRTPWRAGDKPVVAEWLAVNEEPLALVMQASERPRFYIPAVSTGRSTSLLEGMPFVSPGIFEALTCRGMMHVAGGDVESAHAHAMALHRLTSLVTQDGNIWGYIRGHRIDCDAFRVDIELAKAGTLSPGRARQILNDLDNLPAPASFLDVIDYVLRPSVLGIVYNSKGVPHRNAAARRINAWFDRYGAAHARALRDGDTAELHALAAEIQALDTHITQQGAWRRWLPLVYMSRDMRDRYFAEQIADILLVVAFCSDSRMLDWPVAAETQRCREGDLARLVLALAVFRKEQGRYPDSLEELCPAVLERLPDHPFADRELEYRRTEKGYDLYRPGGQPLPEPEGPPQQSHAPRKRPQAPAKEEILVSVE